MRLERIRRVTSSLRGAQWQLATGYRCRMSSSYEGKEVVISYDEKVCTHAGECVRGLPQVFDPKRTPWIQPGDISYGAAEQVIRRCPSGALKIRRA
jgi:uncharacterized Fe-S cluster protein YjdI